jgi:hypothetical protein
LAEPNSGGNRKGVCVDFYKESQVDIAIEKFARAYDEDQLQPSLAAAVPHAMTGRVALLGLDDAENADEPGAAPSVDGRCAVLATMRPYSGAPDDWPDIRPLPPREAVQLLQGLTLPGLRLPGGAWRVTHGQ